MLDGAHFVTDSESEIYKGEEKNKEAHEAFLNQFDLIVDSIFGFSFEGVPRDPFKTIIAALARTKTSVISVDVPSGMPCIPCPVDDRESYALFNDVLLRSQLSTNTVSIEMF